MSSIKNNKMKSNIIMEKTFVESVLSTLRLLFTKKMMFLNLQMFFTGVSISYYSGMLSTIMVN